MFIGCLRVAYPSLPVRVVELIPAHTSLRNSGGIPHVKNLLRTRVWGCEPTALMTGNGLAGNFVGRMAHTEQLHSSQKRRTAKRRTKRGAQRPKHHAVEHVSKPGPRTAIVMSPGPLCRDLVFLDVRRSFPTSILWESSLSVLFKSSV